jgi:hypothetical protein
VRDRRSGLAWCGAGSCVEEPLEAALEGRVLVLHLWLVVLVVVDHPLLNVAAGIYLLLGLLGRRRGRRLLATEEGNERLVGRTPVVMPCATRRAGLHGTLVGRNHVLTGHKLDETVGARLACGAGGDCRVLDRGRVVVHPRRLDAVVVVARATEARGAAARLAIAVVVEGRLRPFSTAPVALVAPPPVAVTALVAVTVLPHLVATETHSALSGGPHGELAHWPAKVATPLLNDRGVNIGVVLLLLTAQPDVTCPSTADTAAGDADAAAKAKAFSKATCAARAASAGGDTRNRGVVHARRLGSAEPLLQRRKVGR